MNLDYLAEWLERHPEIAEIIITETITTTSTHELPTTTGEFFNHLDGSGYQ